MESDAEEFASRLVEEKLVACVSLLPAMRSVYRWKGAVQRADERQLLLKTSSTQLSALEARVRALHPYDVPEFVVIAMTHGSADYLSWLAENTRP